MKTIEAKHTEAYPLGATTTSKPNGVKGEFMTDVVGYRYDPSLDVKEIAKEVRKLIRLAIKEGELPKIKASVTIDRFSMGCALNISVKESAVPVLNRPAWEEMSANRFNGDWSALGGRYTAEGNRILKVLEMFIRSYTKSESDWHSDYYSTNFYGHVSLSELHRAEGGEFYD